jgi:Na+-transporting methylmalonyl-CoA/oxaloacetate decarboxylase gamma subunit
MAQVARGGSIEFTLAPLWEDSGIPLAVMGILVVFMALLMVAVFIILLPRLVPDESTAGVKHSAAMPVMDDDDLPEEIKVVIAAAVAQVLERPHRVIRIRGLTPSDHDWSLEGRLQHHQSHTIQHRSR